MTCFDAESMYRKWIRDIADCQDIFNGHVQHTAPFYGGGGGPGGWGGAMVIVPYAFYKHYGDKALLEKYYPNMLNYLDYMENHSEKGLVVREELAGWCLGDWCSPKDKNLIPEPFVNTYFYLKTIKMTIEIADIIGKPNKELKARYEKVKKAFVDKYYDKKTCTFYKSTEACDAYGFDLGLGNEKTLKAIVDKYEKLGEFDTGIFGTDILIRTLCENGHKDLAFKLLTSEKECLKSPYMRQTENPRTKIIVIAGDRGLAGGYNNNVVKLITGDEAFDTENTEIYALGKKGRDTLALKGYKVISDLSEVMNGPIYADAKELSEALLEKFEKGEIGEIYLAYTVFKNTVTHVPTMLKLLPVEIEAKEEAEIDNIPMNYEPDEEEALGMIIPKYITSLIYGAMMEAVASENGARMQAMDSATSNAEEMIQKLELDYNRARQGSITQELTEIIAGAQAIS